MKGRGTTNRMRGGGTASPKVDQDNLTLSKNMERLQSLRRKLYRPRTPPTKSGELKKVILSVWISKNQWKISMVRLKFLNSYSEVFYHWLIKVIGNYVCIKLKFTALN